MSAEAGISVDTLPLPKLKLPDVQKWQQSGPFSKSPKMYKNTIRNFKIPKKIDSEVYVQQ